MTVHVEKMSSEMTVVDGDLPLTEAQINRLVAIVLRRLAEQERNKRYRREATIPRPSAISFGPTDNGEASWD
jgi:hypothetical protein